ncbi:MAG: T9SS type A sorting domain-containing protein [Bacteroidetes bacterium]|nr:T9SS type A sorting domain-containing protein [Bacteroidota bacterium]MBU1114451.1 T9SS type A sorting domain-containing protein [Bacteroidota bacterium]MBU1799799.1 T9SS type A sorting domain-containing protein [Bacteroidota bacterium]
MSLFKKLFLLLLVFTIQINAQYSAPIVEAVYGGRILDITGYAKTVDTSRIFISTESANSIFYADVYSNTITPTFSQFKAMPGVDANAGFGANLRNIKVHANSGYVFFISNNLIINSNPLSNLSYTIYTGTNLIRTINIIDDYLFFIVDNSFHFGTISTGGAFTESSYSPLTLPTLSGNLSIVNNPLTDTLYIFSDGSTPTVLNMTDDYYSLNSSTTFNSIPVSISSSNNWTAFGIAPDGILLISGNNGFLKYLAYLDSSSIWNEISLGIDGISATNFDFSGDSSHYYIYTAKVFAPNSALLSTWNTFGDAGFETHPNDGAVFVDPINENIIYITTDQGIGASTDDGYTIFEIDNGIEAVSVADFSMSDSKSSAWLASKSGVRNVINYTTTPTWTNSIFPNGDGSPYYSSEMSKDDSNRVFVGNVRIYETTDNGISWNMIFTPENYPYNFSNIETKALAIEECRFSPNIVMAGFEIQGADKGGLFVSEDYGNTWNQILLEASSVGMDVDCSDIIFVREGINTVAYVSAIYDLSAPQGRSIYKVIKTGSSWTASQDMDAAGTVVGYPITATIWDLELTSTGDTLYATGTDAGINHPITYYKDFSGTALWTNMPTSGYPFATGKEATAITIGIDTVYVAVDNEIYYFPIGGSSWVLDYPYPIGTKINVLYFDELLVGTDLGLYAHFGGTTTDIEDITTTTPLSYELQQNYPNPFNPSTTINYSIAKDSNVDISVFNILGQKVKNLVNSRHSAGVYNVKFEASNLSSGVYIYQIKADNILISKKMMLVK